MPSSVSVILATSLGLTLAWSRPISVDLDVFDQSEARVRYFEPSSSEMLFLLWPFYTPWKIKYPPHLGFDI